MAPAAAEPTATASASVPPATAPTADPPSQPMSAQSQTAEGATVFLTHYVALLNWSYQVANAGRLAVYEGPDCARCQATARSIGALAKSRQHAGGDLLSLAAVAAPGNASADPYVVRATLVQAATPLLDPSGATVGALKASSRPVAFHLTWTGMGWQVTDLR